MLYVVLIENDLFILSFNFSLYNAFVIFFQDKKSYKNSGEIHLTYLQLRKAYSFLDYVKGGTELACTFAIDFTASNGNPSSPESLHYFLPNGKLVISKENNN